MKSLYRRYRPLKLSEVVGQEQVTDSLTAALKQGKIGHAYLFVGPRGCGKTSVARILAHEMNGFQYELEDDYVDIVEIDGASNRGIDDIRELREKAAIAPTSGRYKVYIIDEVHMLTKEAFNALLKTLEEPPAHVVFIMATTDAYKVPPTIVSRAQVYAFKLADRQVMQKFLRSVADQEKIKIADDALEVVAKRGGGSFRDSLSLLDQLSTLSDAEITKEMVVSAMGLPENEKIAGLLAEYTSGDTAKITATLKDLLSSGVKAETLAEEMIAAIIDAPRPELLPLLAKLPDVKDPYAEARMLVALCSEARVIARPEPRPAGASPAMGAPSKPSAAPAPTATMAAAPTAFSWEGYLQRMQGVSEVLFAQLKRCEYEMRGSTLHLFPKTKIIRSILDSKNNKKVLLDNLGGIGVMVHEPGEHPESAVKDETLDKISGIMGGEVRNDNGGYNPF